MTLQELQAKSKNIRRQASAKAIARGLESISRARSHSGDLTNDIITVTHFESRGVVDVRPRENVFTFNGWKALGRYVRKGEHGCALTTYVPKVTTDPETGEEETALRCVTTYVCECCGQIARGTRSTALLCGLCYEMNGEVHALVRVDPLPEEVLQHAAECVA